MVEAKNVSVDAQAYERWRKRLMSDPKTRAIYEEEAAKKELWLQLVEARMAAGLTQAQMAKRLGVSQAQVARIEKSGYDSYTLNTLRKYVNALGKGYAVHVEVRTPSRLSPAAGARSIMGMYAGLVQTVATDEELFGTGDDWESS